MPDIRLDLSEAQFADNLLFGIIERLTASIERSKSRELYRESLDMRAASQFTNTLLQSIDRDDPIALQNVIDLLYKQAKVSPSQKKLSEALTPNLEREKEIASERKELFKTVQTFQSDLGKLAKDNLVEGELYDNVISGLKGIGEGLLSETIALGREDRQLIQNVKEKGEKFLQVRSIMQQIDVSAKEGLQLGERLGDINISGESQAGTRLLLEESFKAFESKDIARSLTFYDKAITSATKIEASRIDEPRTEEVVLDELEKRREDFAKIPFVPRPSEERNRKGKITSFDTEAAYNSALIRYRNYQSLVKMYTEDIDRLTLELQKFISPVETKTKLEGF